MSYSVYKHTSPNGKVYIGMTGQNPPERRWGSNGCNYKGKNEHFYRAIEKYGWDNFSHEVLFEGLTKEDAGQKEVELISYYDSTNRDKGYNKSTGGEIGSLGYRYTDEQKKKLSETRKGKKNHFFGKHHSEETRKLISEMAKERYKNKEDSTFYGKHHSEETRKKISEMATGRKHTPESKAKMSLTRKGENNARAIRVAMIDKNNGNVLKIYNCISYAVQELGVNRTTVGMCCKGERKTAGGYAWRYITDIGEEPIVIEPNKVKKMVYQIDKETGDIIACFNSISEAANSINIHRTNITKVCKGKGKTAGGYIWRYVDE